MFPQKTKPKTIIGLMSGTSLDGLDVACIDFWQENNQIHYQFVATQCYPYTAEWKNALQYAHELAAIQLLPLDAAYGNYLGQKINEFIAEFQLSNIDYIASHGHTIFHQPDSGFTQQIGHGAHIQAATNLPVICDFRSQDVALGGQGAPLVPIGDKLLFAEYDACINLGGFANISFDIDEKRVAFDICPVNFVLNHLCQKIGKSFDTDGEIAKKNTVNHQLLNDLNRLEFYQKIHPKSLGREWVENHIFPILDKFQISEQDKIATFTQHIATQIAQIIHQNQLKNILITGGGAYNSYLISEIQSKIDGKIKLGEPILIEYKEALIFALLGYLKSENQINILSSVTGAKRDTSAGILFQ